MVTGGRFLVVNGAAFAGDAPPVTAFLETFSGAYTTTRTHADASLLLFWDRHLGRLGESARILADSKPEFFNSGGKRTMAFPSSSGLESLVHESMRVGLRLALSERSRAGSRDELAITALVRGREDDGGKLDVYLHLGFYVPPAFGIGAHLAVAGSGREVAEAKYSDWARIRKQLEKMRPPSVTELLLSNDGDHILEGSLTNFFIVVRKVVSASRDRSHIDVERDSMFEVQTAPICDGILPGVIRQLVIEVCSDMGIPVKEVAPSWSEHELWEEAFVTSSLRLVQFVETIQAPTTCEDLQSRTWKDVSWVQKRFEGAGLITTKIQREITKRAGASCCQTSNIL
ncbi:uncharacterized protein LOC120268380 [Dioscorea cayenensis subsp. rotundata]|uniref:Uncharacterized protein LOC120268380 n=1 Tax=Dioscorea cayennensis subsp. rotundata TaxID=55577 RepID=A0AB40BWB0_DIOCR|nr:uncharacterized protein LOC120268380 [Dioscorea cayenensis subsp. rotundata]